VDRIEVEIEKLREQLRQNEELRSMQESAYRERESSPAIRFKEPLTLHHNLPYCKFKVQQIIKQETYLQFKQFIYTTRIPQIELN
jgi:hypothetical protein